VWPFRRISQPDQRCRILHCHAPLYQCLLPGTAACTVVQAVSEEVYLCLSRNNPERSTSSKVVPRLSTAWTATCSHCRPQLGKICRTLIEEKGPKSGQMIHNISSATKRNDSCFKSTVGNVQSGANLLLMTDSESESPISHQGRHFTLKLGANPSSSPPFPLPPNSPAARREAAL